MSDFIISLAHFCEFHGPTSILCTQLAPVSCDVCYPCSTPPSELASKSSSFSNDGFWGSPSSGFSVPTQPPLYSPFETPPTSPRSTHSAHSPYFPSRHSERDMYTRYGTTADSEGDACDNCNIALPKEMSERLPDGAPGSPTKDGKGRHGSPVLRTSQTIVAYGRSHCDNESDSSDGENYIQDNPDYAPSLSASPPSVADSSDSNRMYPSASHMHTLAYVTTRVPQSPAAYSLLRRACIRTLSCEHLPRGSSSGPLYFGDPIAGYTIAYVFRLPDPRARGRRRTYALLALGGRDSWRVSMAMVELTKAFESIANRIISMADQVLKRDSSLASMMGSPPAFSSSVPTASQPSSHQDSMSMSSASSSPTPRNITHVSSFLSARTVDPDGYPRTSREVLRAKCLTEIVGKENFFVELHARFCMILSGLVKEFAR